MREIVKDKGGDRAITSREEGPWHPYSWNPFRMLSEHLFFPPCTSVCRSVAVEKGMEDGTMRAQGSRDIVTPSRSPLPVPPPRSNRNPGGAPSSLFLASRACENSCTQAAFRPAPASDPAFVDVRGNAPYTARIIRD